MRICFDLDGTITELKKYSGGYEKNIPLPGIVGLLKKLRAEGHTLILHTARHMQTCSGNVGMVVARRGKELFDWLEKNELEFDEIYFGKPQADIYIDDNALQFTGNWLERDFFSEITNRQATEKLFSMNIVITMAGEGSRFKNAGFILPKPLITVLGKPMYRLSTKSLPLKSAKRLIFIIRKGEYAEQLRKDIVENFGDLPYRIFEVDHLTGGQAETLLLAKNLVDFTVPTLVHNSDSAIELADDTFCRLKNTDGSIFTFTSNAPQYSYARTDEEGRVVEVKEKEVISSHASTGTYYFSSTVRLFQMLEIAKIKRIKQKGEFYIAPLYNEMVNAGMKINTIGVKNYFCYGTPKEREKIEEMRPDFLLSL